MNFYFYHILAFYIDQILIDVKISILRALESWRLGVTVRLKVSNAQTIMFEFRNVLYSLPYV
jgi:hypothetical protein